MKEKPTRAADQERGEERPAQPPRHLAMARTNDPDSATAQFFINVKDNAALDFGIGGAGYAVFGEVIEGMDVVDKIVAVPTTSRGPHQNVPTTPVVIKSARVEGEAVKPARKATPKPRASPPTL